MKNTFSLVILNLVYCEAALRVLGGRNAHRNEFPYVISLEATFIANDFAAEFQICTGAAVTSKWILSAAHCYIKKLLIFARYNSHFPNYKGEVSPILKAYIHPQFDLRRIFLKQSDVALFLSQNILVSQFAKISAVDYKTLVGHKVTILGFGFTNGTEYKKPVQVLDGMMNNCLETEVNFKEFAGKKMCVVTPCQLEATICGGDSGGPVIHPSGIVGVNSMSLDDCHDRTTNFRKKPGTSASIVAMISYELDWITNVISDKTIN